MWGQIRKSFKISMLLLILLVTLSPQAMGASSPQPTIAIETEISLVDGIAVSPDGNIFISRRDNHVISMVDKDGKIRTFAGSGESGFAGDGGPALQAKLRVPAGLGFDKKGNLYIADRENHRVRKIDTHGNITTFAGNGTAGFSGDGGPATQASLNLPSGIVVDEEMNVYIADRSNDRIRAVDAKGVIHTYVGTGVEGFSGDNGPATKAQLNKPFGLALDKKHNLYIADRGNNRIRKVSPMGIISSVAGDGAFFFIGDNGPAYKASIAGPTGVAVDGQGNIFIADRNNNRIRKVDTNGLIRTVAGTGQQDYNGDSELARETNLYLPFALTFDHQGHLLVVDRSHYRIRRINLKKASVETIAGNGLKKFRGDGGPATGAMLNFPHGLAVDSKDNLYISDKSHSRIRVINPQGIINTFAGNGTRGNLGDGGPALDAALFGPTSLVVNQKGELFFVSQSGRTNLIRKISRNGIIDQILGTTEQKFLKAMHLGPKLGAINIHQFSDIALDKKGNIFISDRIKHQIRKWDTKGNLTTIAGISGDGSFTGDGGPATKATLNDPAALTVDNQGNIYIADSGNNRIRKIDTQGIITTIAGNGRHEDSGDDGPALEAGIRSMDDLVVSPDGELYIASANSHRVRKLTKDGKIVAVAGRGYMGYSGDGGPATQAMLKQPTALAFDSKGNLFISDLGNNRIRKVDTQGIITTYAGTSSFGWADEGETVEIYFQNFP